MRSLQGRRCHCNSLSRQEKEKNIGSKSERLRLRKGQERNGGRRKEKENERGQTDQATFNSLLWKERGNETLRQRGRELIRETKKKKADIRPGWIERQGLSVFLWPFNSQVFREAWTRSGRYSRKTCPLKTAMKDKACCWSLGLPLAAPLSVSGLRTKQ